MPESEGEVWTDDNRGLCGCGRSIDDHCLSHALAHWPINSKYRCPRKGERVACEHVAPLSIPALGAPLKPEDLPDVGDQA